MPNILDSVISYLSPSLGAERARNRMQEAMMSGFGSESSGYITAGSPKRSMRSWFTRRLSPDSDHLPKQLSQIASSRDLWMNTPIAGAILKRVLSHTVGFGLFPQSRVERETLGLSDEEADAWERKTEALWRIYAESKDVDLTRQQNFYQLQSLVYFSKLLSGDVFFTLPWVQAEGFPFETRIRVIEADLCSNPNAEPNTIDLAGGVEVDKFGAPTAYWFSTNYGGADILGYTDDYKWVRIPAFDAASGRRNVYHVFDRERPGQRRGIPFLAACVETLKQITRLSEVKLLQNIIQSTYTVFIKDQKGMAQMGESFGAGTSILEENEPDRENLYELGAASIVELDEGKEIQIADPQRTDLGFAEFFASLVKQLSARCEVPFDVLMLHFQASYSATRGELLELYKKAQAWRKDLVADFCQPVYEAWLYEMVAKGQIEAPGFLEDPIKRALWSRTKWGGQGMGQIDPKKETEGALMRIQGHLSNHEDEYTAIHGGDWENSLKRESRERKLIEEYIPKPEPTNRAGPQDSGDDEETDDE